MKVVFFSHAHPVFSKGGGELAAHYLWQGINNHPEHQAWFIGAGQSEIMHKHTTLANIGERNYLIAGNAGIRDLTATTPVSTDSDLAQLLRKIDPDVVHFHHYLRLGVEMIRLVKNTCPDAKIFMTLHEFVAICMNNGQMVKTDGRLCLQNSPRECHLCFPDITPEDLFLREQYIKSFFRLVDKFISPSEFLRDRYIAWGISPERIEVLENGLPEGDPVPLRVLYSGDIRGRFAFFGQINPYKGIDIILEAFERLPISIRKQVTLEIFGSGLNDQAAEFQEKIHSLLKKLKGTVRLHGGYEPEELPQLMREVDWMLMGSVWWENSPLVIQEAFKFGRPIICPDIGGMAEKVKPGAGGLNYRARDSASLSMVIQRIVNEPELFNQLHESLPHYSELGVVARQHIELYRDTEMEVGA